MKSTFRNISALLAAACLAASAFSQTPAPAAVGGPADLIVKVSGKGGTYFKMGEQIQKVCGKPSIDLSESAGTLQAIDDVLNNRANVMFVTTDALWGRKTIENDPQVDNLRVVMPLYNAELHMVARRSDPNVNHFSDLGNKKVGTYGSGYVTARITLAKAGIRPILLQDYKSEDLALQALQKSEVDAVFVVVGQPATWASNLNGQQYKLLDFDRPQVKSAAGYLDATLRYPNLSATVIPTISTKVSLVAYNYESKKRVSDISELKDCIVEHISDFKETTGFHPKWRDVNPKSTSDWPMFQTVSTGSAIVPNIRKKK